MTIPGNPEPTPSQGLIEVTTGRQVKNLIIQYGLENHLTAERREEFLDLFNQIENVTMAVRIAQNFNIDLKQLPDQYQFAINETVVTEGEVFEQARTAGPSFGAGFDDPSQLMSVGEYEAYQAWKTTNEVSPGFFDSEGQFDVEALANTVQTDTSVESWRETLDFAAWEESSTTEDIIDSALSAADNLAPPGDEPDLTFSSPLLPTGTDPGYHARTVGADDYNPWGYVGEVSRKAKQEQITMSGILRSEVQYGDLTQQYVDYMASQFAYTPFFTGDGIYEWAAMSGEDRERWEGLLLSAGLLEEEGFNPGDVSVIQGDAFEIVLGHAYRRGFGPEFAIQDLIEDEAAYQRLRDKIKGPKRPTFSVPASLREIPDYESITQDSTNLFRSRMGRDPEDYEMGILADHMQDQYRVSNQERIKAARAAFNASVSGQQGLMEVEVPNPQLRTQKFLEERYGNEINRVAQISDTANTNRLLINAITTGTGMVP
jgi:hypothetical protein